MSSFSLVNNVRGDSKSIVPNFRDIGAESLTEKGSEGLSNKKQGCIFYLTISIIDNYLLEKNIFLFK